MTLNRTLLARLDRLDGWAATIDRRLAQIDGKLSRLLERLPDPAAQVERDGPVDPLSFRLHGTLYEGFRPVEWRLLKCLWGKKGWATTIEEALDEVYGVNAGYKEKAIISALKKLSCSLLDKAIPLFVRQQAGYFILESAKSRKGSRRDS